MDLLGILDITGEISDLSARELVNGGRRRFEYADLFYVIDAAGPHHLYLHAFSYYAVLEPYIDHDALERVKCGVDYKRLQGIFIFAFRRRYKIYDRLHYLVYADTTFSAGHYRLYIGQMKRLPELVADPFGFRAGKVYLVYYRDYHEIVFSREIQVGDGLRLHPLRGIYDKKYALTGGERFRDLVGEIHMTGRVDEVKDIFLSAGRVRQPHRFGLDSDAALPLEVHAV